MINFDPASSFDWTRPQEGPVTPAADPPPRADGLIGITDKVEGASNLYADITREQWADYVRRFHPLEDELMDAYRNPEQRAERIGEARGLARQGFASAQGQGQRQAARYGLNMTEDPAWVRRQGLGMAAATADAANQTRRHMNDRDRLLLAGGLSTKEM